MKSGPHDEQDLQALEIEHRPSVQFALDEEDAEEQLLLAQDRGAATADAAAAPAAAAGRRHQLRRTASRFTLNSEQDDSWASYRHEASRQEQPLCSGLLELALPLTISQFFTFALGLISVAFIGRLGEHQMAVAVLATSFSNVTGFSVVLGLLGALDTLCGQAWGARQYRLLGLYLQRALVTTLATCAAISLLWAHVEPLMLAAGQQEAIAAGAARYLLLSIPALVAAGVFECYKRYLMSQGVVRPVTAVSCVAVALAPLFNWLLIFRARLGLDGAVYAMILTWVVMLAMLCIYLAWHERRRAGTPEQTWHGWSRECLRDLWPYYRLAVPSTLMVCLEWWAYEFTIFIAGWLPNPTLNVAAHGAMMQVSGFVYMLPMGISCAATVRVSNALGANLPRGARRGAFTATGITCLTQACLSAALVLGRNHWGAVFTNLREVVTACAAAFPIMAGCMPGDGLNATVGGILRGAGLQELGALLNLGSYWGLGLPAAYLLAFKAGWGLRGLWAGLALCTSVQAVVMLTVLSRFKWAKEAQRAADLVSSYSATSELSCEDSAAKLGEPGGACGSADGSSHGGALEGSSRGSSDAAAPAAGGRISSRRAAEVEV